MTAQTHHLLGEFEPDPVGQMLSTRYQRFESPFGINGLARWTDEQLDLLAVHATRPGNGQFRAFIRAAMENFQTICIWHVDNSALRDALTRYGFTPEDTIDEFGEHLTGLRWDKE